MKLWAYFVIAALIAAAFAGQARWFYERGRADCEGVHAKAAVSVQAAVLDKAATNNRVDQAAATVATEAVEGHRAARDRRLERIANAPITPATGGPDATHPAACPDVLGPDFWGLYHGADRGGANPATSGGAGGVPR